MRSYARYWLQAFRVPAVPVDRLVGVPVDQRGPVIARYREAAGRVVGPVFAKPPDARDHPVSRIDSNPGR